MMLAIFRPQATTTSFFGIELPERAVRGILPG
jgi:hypothetical protein